MFCVVLAQFSSIRSHQATILYTVRCFKQNIQCMNKKELYQKSFFQFLKSNYSKNEKKEEENQNLRVDEPTNMNCHLAKKYVLRMRFLVERFSVF